MAGGIERRHGVMAPAGAPVGAAVARFAASALGIGSSVLAALASAWQRLGSVRRRKSNKRSASKIWQLAWWRAWRHLWRAS